MAKLVCPECGGQLQYLVKTEGIRGHKINKDGTLSKQTLKSLGTPTDIYFVKCDKCNFIYKISYQDMNNKQYQEIDDWYQEYGEVIL